jgi:hypothetical protein
MKLRSAIVAGSLVATAGAIGIAVPAYADLTTTCVGTGGPVTVPNDLVVPANKSCWLDGTIVQGDVRVGKNADLVAEGVTIEGNVQVAQNGYFDADESMVEGSVNATNAYGAYVVASEVGRAVTVRGDTTTYGFVYALESRVGGRLLSDGPEEAVVDGSWIGGNVVSDGTRYTDVYDSTLEGALTVTGSPMGAVFCASEVDGNVSYSGNSEALQIGASGPLVPCEGASYFGGNVDISDNTGTTVVSNTIIRGDLSGEGNDPAPVGENNRVRGTMSGQFADLPAPTASQLGSGRMAERADQVVAKAEARRAEATAQAQQAGKAGL